MKLKTFTYLFFVLLSFASFSNAAFVERDLLAKGDGLITYDTNSHLEWLDLYVTEGLSYSNVAASDYVTSFGFRLSTEAEYLSLITNFGAIPDMYVPEALQKSAHTLHMMLDDRNCVPPIAVGFEVTSGLCETWGLLDGPSESAESGLAGRFSSDYNGNNFIMHRPFLFDLQNTPTSLKESYVTSFLVRPAMPASSTKISGDAKEGLAEAIQALQTVVTVNRPVCSPENLERCNIITCSSYGQGFWYDERCHPSLEPACGNGVLDSGEDCDLLNLNESSCEDLRFVRGALSCNEDCTFNTSECIPAVCGDGAAELWEECDKLDFNGSTCLSEGYDAGELTCTRDCTIDTSGCLHRPYQED